MRGLGGPAGPGAVAPNSPQRSKLDTVPSFGKSALRSLTFTLHFDILWKINVKSQRIISMSAVILPMPGIRAPTQSIAQYPRIGYTDHLKLEPLQAAYDYQNEV